MKQIKLITYNIDGLPEKLDLNDLPLILKPIAWIYKLIKGTTIVDINDNTDSPIHAKNIGNYLLESKADIIAVQEDFNYHDILMNNAPEYKCGTQKIGFNLSKIFSSIRWFPYPRFKSDGINIIYNKRIKINKEDIVKWKKSYGYFTHANDKLTTKGFRFYNVTLDDSCELDVYIVHMDADFYHPENCSDVSKDIAARKAQINQLIEYIKNRNSKNPIIIMGDTNSYDKYTWDVENIKYLKNNLNLKEVVPNNFSDCDKIFISNNLEVKECYFDIMVNESDHKPLIAILQVMHNL